MWKKEKMAMKAIKYTGRAATTAIVLAAFTATNGTTALATMPLLDDMPHSRTPAACRAWADKQPENGDGDVGYMWGQHEDGRTDRATAVQRLTDNCLGKPVPEIVGFGSSNGFDTSYCKRHPRVKICIDLRRRAR
jgi:hypothetical protein